MRLALTGASTQNVVATGSMGLFRQTLLQMHGVWMRVHRIASHAWTLLAMSRVQPTLPQKYESLDRSFPDESRSDFGAHF
jgi:hypothetical protein